MRVLHIPTGGLFADGILSCIMAYAQAMDRTDLEITILAPNRPEEKILEKIRKADCLVSVISYRKQDTKRYIEELYGFLKNHPFDIVHVHGSSAIMSMELLTARAAGCRVRIAHSHNTACENKRLDRLLRPIFRRSFDYGFACGQEAGKWLFQDKKFIVIPNGRNLAEYEFREESRAFWRNELAIPPDSLVIGHIGCFNYQKNHEYLLRVFSEIVKGISDAHLVMIGVGEYFEKIEEEVKKSGFAANVHFMGTTDRVGELLSAMDIMLLPSRYEGLPIVVIEWQASGLPCIISDVITDECRLTGLVTKLSIEEEPRIWAETVKNMSLPDRNSTREEMKEKIKGAGYDIESGGVRLKQLYQAFLKEKNR